MIVVLDFPMPCTQRDLLHECFTCHSLLCSFHFTFHTFLSDQCILQTAFSQCGKARRQGQGYAEHSLLPEVLQLAHRTNVIVRCLGVKKKEIKSLVKLNTYENMMGPFKY